MTETIMGNSGFKYIETTIVRGRNSYGVDSKTCVIKDVKTDETFFTVIGKEGAWKGRGIRATKKPNTIGVKRFLGFDNRYYYIEVTYVKVIWGQIQSSGAVIAQDRTIIKQLDFFPMNIETPTVPVVKIIPVAPLTCKSSYDGSLIPDIPLIKSLTPVISDKKEIKWIEQIMNQIGQLINRINKIIDPIIQSILNQLKQNK